MGRCVIVGYGDGVHDRGGVGQAVISIALALQCEVFTTVGNLDKVVWGDV